MTYWSNELSEISGGDIKVKFVSADGNTKFLSLTEDQFESIKDVVLSVEEPEEQPQRVVFRKFPHNGDIIALFPDQYDKRTGMIGSYMHNGQHSDTYPDFGDTKAADYYEYADLHMELIRQGYTNLKVVKRITIRKDQR